MKKAFTLLICLGLVLLLVLAPSVILEGLQKNTYTLREEEQSANYTGNLSLWHIVSFKTGGNTGISFLRNRIREFEKNNPYVFIDLTALDMEEAGALLAAGQTPDILSFPLGFIENSDFLAALPAADGLLQAYRSAGILNGITYAYPYMADFYALLCNQDMFFYTDATLPLDTSLTKELFYTMLDKIAPYTEEQGIAALTLSDTTGLCPAAACLFLRGETNSVPPAALASALPGGADSFLEDGAALYLCPAAEAQKVLSDNRANMVSLRIYSLSTYTDMVQFVGVSAGLEEQKYAMCADFAAYLLSDRAQAAVEALKMLPVTRQQTIYEGAPLYMEEYQSIGQEGIVPNTFLFALQRDSIASIIQNSLQNNLDTQDALLALIKE